jgi:hypothetical protein
MFVVDALGKRIEIVGRGLGDQLAAHSSTSLISGADTAP